MSVIEDPPSERVLRWQIGAVRISAIVEVDWPLRVQWMVPEATDEHLAALPWVYDHFVRDDGMMTIAVQAFVVESDGRRIVVDTCAGNGKRRAGVAGGFDGLDTDFPDRCARAGFPFESIDTVVCTHLHFDHVGWNTMLRDDEWVASFANARYLFTADDLTHWATHPEELHAAAYDDSVAPLVAAGLVDAVAPDHVITPEVRLVPTPGHSPGHASVWIDSNGDQAVITGDMVHHPVQLARPAWHDIADGDAVAAARTRAAFADRVRDTAVLVLGTHFDAPTGGSLVVRDGDARFVPAAQ
jgi:glyoxylase-like metal-dependent hydrolase (beta-lactamase superfamily II)